MPFEIYEIDGGSAENSLEEEASRIKEKLVDVYTEVEERKWKIVGGHVLTIARGRNTGPDPDQLFLVAEFPEIRGNRGSEM